MSRYPVSDVLDRDGIGLVEAAVPADRPDRLGGRQTVPLFDQYAIDEGRLEQVLQVLLDVAPHLLVPAGRDPLAGIDVEDQDMTSGSITCSALGPWDEDLDGRPECSRGLHPAAWDHLRGNGAHITHKWTGDHR